jgi:hypothetical protein
METKEPTKPRGTKTSLKKDNRTTLKIANSTIIIGETYEVRPKTDYTAPDGMQRAGTTKYLNAGNAEIRGINFDEEKRKWDTGFDESSLCNFDLLDAEKTATVKLFNKHIKEPYESAYNVDCSSNNDSFWLEYTYEIKTNKSFNTEDPKDLFDLFQAIKHGRLCEAGERDYALQKANYTLKNTDKVKTLEEERMADKFEAISTFSVMLNENLEKDDTLLALLEWLQITNVRNAEKSTLRNIVMRMFDHPINGYEFSRRFLESIKLTESADGKKRMELFSVLQKLYLKNKIEQKRGTMYIDGHLLGNTLKEASQKAMDNPEISDAIYTSYENNISK